jgi:hypothetical protein
MRWCAVDTGARYMEKSNWASLHMSLRILLP